MWYSLEPPRQGGSNEYPQSMFLSKSKKTKVYPCKPQFYYIKVGLKGVNIIQVCFRDETYPLRKHAYSNILKISPPKTESFPIKVLIFFHISAQNIDCGTR